MGLNLAENKRSLYEILGVAPTASLAELKAGHRRLSLEIMSGKLGVSREDCDYRLQLLDVALSTLSDPCSRDAYDLQLAEASRANRSFPVSSAIGAGGAEGRAPQLAAVVEDVYKANVPAIDERQFQLAAVSQTVGASMRSLQIILRVVFWLLLLGIVIRLGSCTLAARMRPGLPPAAVAKAEEMLMIQAYFKQTGVRAASRAEVEALQAEARRLDDERREEEFKQRRADYESDRFFAESQEISRRLEEEQARAEAEARYVAIERQRQARSAR